MKRCTSLIIISILGTLTIKAQVKFFDKFTLRQSFQSTNENAEPATISFTKPKDLSASWLLNAALGYNLLANSKKIMSLDPFVEFHKNTLVAEEQNNWQTGIAFDWQTTSFSLASKNWSPILIASVQYNEDKMENNTSFQGNVYVTFIRKKKGLDFKYFYLPNHPVYLGKVLQFEYSPYAGFENENRIKYEKDSSKGNIYRVYGRVTSIITLFPKNTRLRGRFEFNIDYQYRNDFARSVKDIPDDVHEYFTTSFNYNFFPNEEERSAKIGFDYINGEDPTTNFEKQSYYAISLKVRL